MLITEKTAVTFRLPKEKELMEKFMEDNPDWYYEVTSNQVTFKRTQMFEVGREDGELATEQMEHDALYEPTYNPEDGSM